MFEILLPFLIGGLKWIGIIVFLITFKKWIIVGACIVAGYLVIRGADIVLGFIKTILGNAVLRWTVGLTLLVGGSFITGYFSKTIPQSERVKVVHVQRPAENIRSTALIKDGTTYYSQTFVNELLKRHNVTVELKNLSGTK